MLSAANTVIEDCMLCVNDIMYEAIENLCERIKTMITYWSIYKLIWHHVILMT